MRLGPYELVHLIARGGMSSVWVAYQHGGHRTHRLVALKMVLPDLDGRDFRSMFMEEARVAARINHPNVCRIFELIDHDGLLALSMEWIDGGTLGTVLAASSERGLLDLRVTAQIVANVAGGLHAAHELRDERGAPMQLVHRDVSPQNVLIARDGRVKVSDFGIAKARGRIQNATAVGTVKGKISYMSPEQAQGKTVDRRSDIFSLGVILYLATVGTHPFRRPGESSKRQFARLLFDPITPPSELASNYPKELETILLGALERNPSERFATAHELRCQLQDWIDFTGPLLTKRDIAAAAAGRLGAASAENKHPASRLGLREIEQNQDATPPTGIEACSGSRPPLDSRAVIAERPTARPQRRAAAQRL